MLLGICPKCQDYTQLTTHIFEGREVVSLCMYCDTEVAVNAIPKQRGFIKYLLSLACNYRDEGNRIMLYNLKVQARKLEDSGSITESELLQVERIFCSIHPI